MSFCTPVYSPFLELLPSLRSEKAVVEVSLAAMRGGGSWLEA
jgi:hypothetical protein